MKLYKPNTFYEAIRIRPQRIHAKNNRSRFTLNIQMQHFLQLILQRLFIPNLPTLFKIISNEFCSKRLNTERFSLQFFILGASLQIFILKVVRFIRNLIMKHSNQFVHSHPIQKFQQSNNLLRLYSRSQRESDFI